MKVATEDEMVDDITNSMDMSEQTLVDKWRTGKPGMLQTIGSQRVGHDWANEQEPQHRTLILEESQRPAISEGMKKILWFLWLKTEFSLTFQVIMYD